MESKLHCIYFINHSKKYNFLYKITKFPQYLWMSGLPLWCQRDFLINFFISFIIKAIKSIKRNNESIQNSFLYFLIRYEICRLLSYHLISYLRGYKITKRKEFHCHLLSDVDPRAYEIVIVKRVNIWKKKKNKNKKNLRHVCITLWLKCKIVDFN